ncbi:MAG: beta-ketoacyl-ACP synthase II [Deltaproteobacteria bacterium]|nr:beta-ketoacyl-ACP synthase II [Deltaproteobacteria bacterium]
MKEGWRRRVVITGIGVISPLGLTAEKTWEGILAGRSGIGPITHFDSSDSTVKIAGEVRGFEPEKYLPEPTIRKTDLFIQYACAASFMAVEDSKLTREEVASERTAVVIASGMGGIPAIEKTFYLVNEKGHRRISPFFIPMIIPNLAAGMVSITLGAQGPNTCPATACAAGTHALGEAFGYIRHGVSDLAVAGGAEAIISPVAVGGFNAMRALSRRNEEPEKASRPFDRDRDGFVISEGSGILVLEEFERAVGRGARIYAEIIGYALNSDAHHITNPAPEGIGPRRCIQLALKDAEIGPEKIDYINAHGTSTKVGDINETNAIKAVFGEHARQLCVSSTKSMTGHLMGAAGGIEAAISAKALHEGIIPPTINLDHPDPECDLDYVPGEARKKEIQYALSNSFGFGGTNGCLIFKKWEG